MAQLQIKSQYLLKIFLIASKSCHVDGQLLHCTLFRPHWTLQNIWQSKIILLQGSTQFLVFHICHLKFIKIIKILFTHIHNFSSFFYASFCVAALRMQLGGVLRIDMETITLSIIPLIFWLWEIYAVRVVSKRSTLLQRFVLPKTFGPFCTFWNIKS